MKRSALLAMFCICLCAHLSVYADTNQYMAEKTLPSLLRIDRHGDRVSSDLSDYVQFDCTGLGPSRTCSASGLPSMSEFIKGDSSNKMVSYADGVMMYSAINFAAMVLLILLTLAWVGCGLFCLCLRCCKCCLKPKSFFKPETRYIALNVCLSVFLVVIFIVTILGHVAGGSKLFNAIGSVPEAANGAANIYAEEMGGPVVEFGINTISSVLLPLFAAINSTLLSAFNLQAISNDLHRLNDTIYKLPNIANVRATLGYVEDDVNDISWAIGNISSSIQNINSQTNYIETAANVISTDLSTISTTMMNVTKHLNTTLVLVDAFATKNDILFGISGSTTGKIDSISSDLSTISRSNTPGQGFPMVSSFDDAASGATGSMDRLLGGSFNGQNSAELATLNSRLFAIYDMIAQLPNYHDTADDLRYVNSTVVSIVQTGGLIDQLIDSIDTVNTELASLPSSTTFIAHVTDLYDETKSISLSKIRLQVNQIQNIVNRIPTQIDALYMEAIKLPKVIPLMLPILLDLMITQLEGFNSTIAKLPVNSTKLYHTISTTLTDSIETTSDLLETLNSTKISVFDVNITEYFGILDGAQRSLDDNINSFNFTDLTNKLNSMFSSLKTNFTSYTNQLTSVKSSFQGYFLPNSTVAHISELQYFRSQLEQSLQRAISPIGYSSSTWNTPATRSGDYLLLAKGVCTTDTTVYCSANSDCVSVSGICSHIGEYRCSPNGDGSAATLACTADATCSSALGTSSYCLADNTRAVTLRTWLHAFGSSSGVQLPDTSSITSDLSGLQNSKYDTSSATNALQDAVDNAGLVNTAQYQQDIDSAVSGLNAFDMANIQSTLDDVQSSVDNFEFSSFDKSISQVEDKRSKIIDNINEILTLIDNLVVFFYSSQPNQLGDTFHKLSSGEMYAKLSTSGASGVLTYASAAIDRTSQTIHDIFDKLTVTNVDAPVTNLTKSVRGYRNFLDKATQNPHSKYNNVANEQGPLYYLLSQSSMTSGMVFNPIHDGDTVHPYSVFKDSDGNRYPDNKICVSNLCFENTQKEYETGEVVPGITYATVAGLVWVPIAMIFLVALCTALCPLCTKSPRLRTCPGTCLLILLIAVLPWYMIGTAFILPFTIVMSDGCATGPDIGSSYVAAYGDSLCSKFKGDGGISDCLITTQGFKIHVDFQGIANGFLGSCSSAVDPFNTILSGIAGPAVEILQNRTKKVVKTTKSIKKLRHRVKDIIIDSGTNAGDVVSQFASGTAEIIDCEHIAAVFNDMKKPICTDMVGALGWFSAMLYLAAWTMCCVGIPAGCCVQHHYKWLAIEQLSAPKVVDDHDDEGDGDKIAVDGDDDDEHNGHDPSSGVARIIPCDVESGVYVSVADSTADHLDLVGGVEIAPVGTESRDSKGDYIPVSSAPVEVEMVSRPNSAKDTDTSKRVSVDYRSRTSSSPRSEAVSTTGITYEAISSSSSSEPTFEFGKTLEDVKSKRAQLSSKLDSPRSRESLRIAPSTSPPRSPRPYTGGIVDRESSPENTSSSATYSITGVIPIIDHAPDKNSISMSIDELTEPASYTDKN